MQRLVVLAMLCFPLPAAPTSGWVLSKDTHFEVYCQSGQESGERILTWLEQLRGFFGRTGLMTADSASRPPLRVIAFRSVQEYEAVRHSPSADAYFLASEDRDYIVMPLQQPHAFATAAHEYAHSVLHANGLHLPLWLSEGLAGYFSTVRVNANGYELGGAVPEFLSSLRNGMMPLPALFQFRQEGHPKREVELFYAESWALTDLLINSQPYAAGFPALIQALNGGADTTTALASVYGKTSAEVQRSLEAWLVQAHSSKPVPASGADFEPATSAAVSELEAQALIADLFLADRELDRAQARFSSVAQQRPGDPDAYIALGKLALLKDQQDKAYHLWSKAFALGAKDPQFCYRYALLAEDLGDTAAFRAGLERAIALRPAFDDARFRLALFLKSKGEYRPAVEHFRAMKPPNKDRAFAYWAALASALTDLDERQEAYQAADQAIKAARNDTDRALARTLRVLAVTDPAVQFTTDAEGRAQIVSTRMQHGSNTWNPFIEPSDNVQRATGELREVLCNPQGLTGFIVQTNEGRLTLQVSDPGHVLLRDSPGEFTCGQQQARTVQIEYALVRSAGNTVRLLRGMTF